MPGRDGFGLAKAFDRMVLTSCARPGPNRSDRLAGLAVANPDRRPAAGFQPGHPGGRSSLNRCWRRSASFLQTELKLAGMALLVACEPDAVPTATVRGCCPAGPARTRPAGPIGRPEAMDPGDCARASASSSPGTSAATGRPSAAAIDATLRLGLDHPAYCIPFHVGGKVQTVAHMLLPPGRDWDEDALSSSPRPTSTPPRGRWSGCTCWPRPSGPA